MFDYDSNEQTSPLAPKVNKKRTPGNQQENSDEEQPAASHPSFADGGQPEHFDVGEEQQSSSEEERIVQKMKLKQERIAYKRSLTMIRS